MMMGSWAGVVNDKVFKQSRSDSVHNTEVFSLMEKRCAFVSEMAEEDKFNEVLMKKITGGDEINIRACGSNENVSVNFNCIMWLATNGVPIFHEKAFIERMRIVSFHTVFQNNPNREKEVLNKVDDFFSLACIMAKKYYDDKCKIVDVKEVLESTKEVVDERDTFKSWVDGCFEDEYVITTEWEKNDKGLPYRTKKSSVLSSYVGYCLTEKVKSLGKQKFYKAFDEKFNLDGTYDKGMFWTGLRQKGRDEE